MISFPLHIHSEATVDPSLMHALTDALWDGVYICLLVIVMMTLIEIFNVATQGKAFRKLGRNRTGQICVSGALGLIPGCIGGLAGVSLYSHRIIGFGALLATLVATTGDEAFMMLAMFPMTAIPMMLGLFCLGSVTGIAADVIVRSMQRKGLMLNVGSDRQEDDNYEIHECDVDGEEDDIEHTCDGHAHKDADHEGHAHGHHESYAHAAGFKFWHFIREHVWQHIIKRHLPAIFAWTFGVLAAFNILSIYIDMESWVEGNTALLILFAVALGLIPESGPHMIFVTMFASGILPFPVLLASCIAQDGHSCLPLIAENRHSFLTVKIIKTCLALIAGFSAAIICP